MQTSHASGMRKFRRPAMSSVLPALVTTWLAAGCAGAPSIPIAGAYFPAWLLCAVIGIVAALAARVVFAATGLADAWPLQLLVCTSVGIVCAGAVWAAW